MTTFSNLATSQPIQAALTSVLIASSQHFFKFTAAIAAEMRAARLTAAEWNFWSYLVTLDPFGDRGVEFHPAQLLVELGISKSTYYAAKAKFQELGWFTFQDGKTTFRNCRGINSPELLEIFRSGSPKFRNESPGFQTPVRNLGIDSEISEFSETEPLSEKSSSSSQTYSDLDQTSSDDLKEKREKKEREIPDQNLDEGDPTTNLMEEVCLEVKDPSPDQNLDPVKESQDTGWDKFSAPGAEPKFFDFVVRRTAKFPKPPADPHCAAESWIRKQGHVLYPQYLEWQEGQKRAAERAQSPQIEVAPPPEPQREEMTPQMWLERYQQMWQAGPKIQKQIRCAVAEHPERGLRIGQDGPELVVRESSTE